MSSLTFKPCRGDCDVNWYALLIAIVKGVSSEAALGAMGISHCNMPKPKQPSVKKGELCWRNRNRDLAIYAAHDARIPRNEIAEMFGMTPKAVTHVLNRRKIHIERKELDP